MKKLGFAAAGALALSFVFLTAMNFHSNNEKISKLNDNTSSDSQDSRLKALIYKGEGSCIEDCSEAAALMADLAGFKPVFVYPENLTPSVFKDAAVWIQPGGESLIISQKISKDFKKSLRDFIKQGGGYVGFCAGAFFADDDIHGTHAEGMGFIPGNAIDYAKAPAKAAMLELTWNGKKRTIYWEEGPYLNLNKEAESFTPFAYYPTGEIASVRGNYFKGRVSITGVHPEAPQYWRDDINAQDPDGLDYQLAVEMIRWAGQNNSLQILTY